MTYRFSLYAVPHPDHPLWCLGNRWLGRDADDTRDAGTTRFFADARRYGFHGTLKAPFRLAPGRSEAALRRDLCRFAAGEDGLAVTLAISDDLGFLALRPVGGEARVRRLADACVIVFDDYRAPLSAAEQQRRLAGGGLSDRQQALLATYGYPYVLDQFRYHMTLADPCPDPGIVGRLADAARSWFAPALAAPVPLDLALFIEPEPGTAFQLAERYPLGRR
jgi:hypothetical protein